MKTYCDICEDDYAGGGLTPKACSSCQASVDAVKQLVAQPKHKEEKFTYIVIMFTEGRKSIKGVNIDSQGLRGVTQDYARAKAWATDEYMFDNLYHYSLIEKHREHMTGEDFPLESEWFEFQAREGYHWGSGEVDIVPIPCPERFKNTFGFI